MSKTIRTYPIWKDVKAESDIYLNRKKYHSNSKKCVHATCKRSLRAEKCWIKQALKEIKEL